MAVAERKNIDSIDSPTKRIFRRLLGFIIRILVSKNIKDVNSGFRIMRKVALMEYLPFLCSTFSITTGITILFFEHDKFVSYRPTNYRNRIGDSKVRHVKDTIRVVQTIVQGVTFNNPLKFFFFLTIGIVLVICIPAMIIALLGYLTLSLYFMAFGSVVSILIGLGVLGDIVRISIMKLGQPSERR